ncbi:low-density lipoprotein receptor class A domain-containing protein 2 precursor [Camelus ferus]|nr:low-density lipoprotein receptor class A domain-containing protein 2 precursor [Camelus ferus]
MNKSLKCMFQKTNRSKKTRYVHPDADLVDLCGQTWQGDGLLLRSHPASRRFYFFYEGPPEAPRPLGAPLCGLTIPAPVASSGDFLGLRLVTRGRQPRVDFVGEVTSFRLAPGSCGAYFPCRNGRCIPQSLVCDRWGMDNCGDGSDQASRPPADCTGPRLQGVALASSLLLASAGLLIGLLWCCCSSSWLARRAGAHGLCPSCTICYPCPGQLALKRFSNSEEGGEGHCDAPCSR